MTTTVDGNSGGTAVTTTTLPTLQGQVLQVVNYQTGAVATGTTTIPLDDSIPQNTEGTEFMTLAITPRSATSKLVIEVVVFGTQATSTLNLASALFQDSTATALATAWNYSGGVNVIAPMNFIHYMTSGTTSSTTFKVRAGATSAATFTFNGYASARYFGGSLASSITITEVVP